MLDDHCDFCQLANGQTQSESNLIKTWPDAVAVSPLQPATAGHLLVIPKQHFKNVFELPPIDASKVWAHTLELGRVVKRILHPDGVNIITSDGRAATQSVFHLHIHVVPRYHGDRIVDFWPEDGIKKNEESEALAKVRAYL